MNMLCCSVTIRFASLRSRISKCLAKWTAKMWWFFWNATKKFSRDLTFFSSLLALPLVLLFFMSFHSAIGVGGAIATTAKAWLRKIPIALENESSGTNFPLCCLPVFTWMNVCRFMSTRQLENNQNSYFLFVNRSIGCHFVQFGFHWIWFAQFFKSNLKDQKIRIRTTNARWLKTVNMWQMFALTEMEKTECKNDM